MKKVVSVLLVLTFLACFPITAFASESNGVSSVEIIYYTDGSRVEIETIIYNNTRVTSTKSASRTQTYYDADDVKCFSVTLTGTFSYDFITSTCTKSSATSSIYKTGWRKDSVTATRSGDTAYADGYFSSNSGDTGEIHIELTCDSDGNIA